MKLNFALLRGRYAIVLCIILSLAFSGCRKDLLTPGAEQTNTTRTLGHISFEQLSNELNRKQLGVLNTMFSQPEKSKTGFATIKTVDVPPIILSLHNITRFQKDGHSVYSIPLKPSTPRARTFQNLSIDQSDAGTVATLITFDPDSLFMQQWLNRDPATKFTGRVYFKSLDLTNGQGVSILRNEDQIKSCQTLTLVVGVINNMCSCSGNHWPWQISSCVCDQLGGQLPSTDYVYSSVSICDPQAKEVPPVGGGGGGNPVTYPVEYNPCLDRDGCGEGNPYLGVRLSWIQYLLDLDMAQAEALTSPDYGGLVNDLYNSFTGLTTLTHEDQQNAYNHIQLALFSPEIYMPFYNTYRSTKTTGQYLWWKDEAWLMVPSNVDLIVDGPADFFDAMGFYDEETDVESAEGATDDFDEHVPGGILTNRSGIAIEVRAVADQLISHDLASVFTSVVTNVNDASPIPMYPITTLYVYSTSESTTKHAPLSNHYSGNAMDISRINRVPIQLLGPANYWVQQLQTNFETFTHYRWENYGPFMEKKDGVTHVVGGHSHHIHFATRYH